MCATRIEASHSSFLPYFAIILNTLDIPKIRAIILSIPRKEDPVIQSTPTVITSQFLFIGKYLAL